MSDQLLPEYTGERVAQRADQGAMLMRRWAGCWIDFIVLAVMALGPILLVGLAGPAGAGPIAAGAMLLSAVFVLGYFPITEGLWGRSLGKLVTGTIVVRRDGTPAGVGKATIRTLLRLIEVNPFLMGGIPAGICLLCTKGKQRLGDLAAQTYVVPVKDLRAAMSSTNVF